MNGGGGGSWASKVLRDIRGYYGEALEQLPVEEIPSLLTAGACFGLLDPVSNIIVNTATAGGESARASRKNKKRKRSQRSRPPPKDKEEALALAAAGIAKRSLEGLLSFLVSHFRHLDDQEALHYLCLANADLLVASRLIDLDRCATSLSDPCSKTFKVALTCAAISAKHPCRAALTGIWLSLATSPPADQQNQLLALSSNPCLQELLLKLPSPVRLGQLYKPRQLKALRKQQSKKAEPRPGVTELRVGRLLEMVHLVYLKAIACLPRDAFRARHHRGLLKAGHCFGPMDDPVSNILLNTIWYDSVFPAQNEFLVDMLCTNSLTRVEVRSAVGLIKFLCTHFPDLIENRAVVLLLEAGANLGEAISMAKRQGHDASGSLRDAYMVAARAAWHPEPEALAEFVLSIDPIASPAVLTLRALRGTGDRSLSACDVDVISASFATVPGLLCSSSNRSMHQVPKLNKLAVNRAARHKDRFGKDQFYFRAIAEAALQSLGTMYQLYVICGVNAAVAEKGKHGYYDLLDGYPYCHINFLARPWGSTSEVGTVPKLFFAECTHGYKNTKVVTCCVVDPSKDSGRCFHCEKKGIKIVHPSYGGYDGCDKDFKEMARRDFRSLDSSDLIILEMRRTKYMGFIVEEDSVYFDPRWDIKFAECFNNFVLAMKAQDEEEKIFLRGGCVIPGS